MRSLPGLAAVLLIAYASTLAGPPQEWPISDAANEGLRPDTLSLLNTCVRTELPHVRSLLIARHGRLVFEEYYGDASRDAPHNVQSMMKSVSSALVGIALRKGLITSVEEKVLDYLPEYRNAVADPAMREITIRHLLTMSSGLDEVPLSFDKALDDPIALILQQRLLCPPGHGFKYSSAAAHLLGEVLRKATGRAVLEFAETELFRPLGIQRVVWYADKTGLQSGGMSGLLRSRDMLKLGELYLRKGSWRGKEIISPSYIEDSVRVQNAGDFFGERVRYGYMWWIATVGGHQAFYARGYGGQYLMVIPTADLVVLCTSDWKQPEYPAHFKLLERFVLPSIEKMERPHEARSTTTAVP